MKTEFLLELIKNEWADIHHTRNQEWTNLVIIGGIFYAFFAVPETMKAVIAAFGFLACILSIMMLYRHWKLFKKKVRFITLLQREIGVEFKFHKDEKEDKKKSEKEKFSVQSIIMLFYFLICSALVGGAVWYLFTNLLLFICFSAGIFILGIILCFFVFPSRIENKVDEVKINLINPPTGQIVKILQQKKEKVEDEGKGTN